MLAERAAGTLLRIASGSIIGPWLLHGSANFAVTLSVLARTMPSG